MEIKYIILGVFISIQSSPVTVTFSEPGKDPMADISAGQKSDPDRPVKQPVKASQPKTNRNNVGARKPH
jgi:hypothetical protein